MFAINLQINEMKWGSFVFSDQKSESFNMTTGAPQGSVLRPLFFCV